MKWTEPKLPTEGESYYDHVKCQTPLGEFLIEWKSWKEFPDYGVMLNGEYVTTSYELEDAKEDAEMYLIKVRDNLNDFLKDENK
jgi:hypothetical protein